MINALQEISNAPEGKYLNSLAPTVCKFLLSSYKDEGRSSISQYVYITHMHCNVARIRAPILLTFVFLLFLIYLNVHAHMQKMYV